MTATTGKTGGPSWSITQIPPAAIKSQKEGACRALCEGNGYMTGDIHWFFLVSQKGMGGSHQYRSFCLSSRLAHR